MRLSTSYAPGSYLKPCLVVDTVFNSKTKETALKFVHDLHHEALHADHALAFGGDHAPPSSDWVVIQQHDTQETAIAFHLKIVAPFHNGGTQEEWDEGWEPYLALYEAWCPVEFRTTP